MYSENFTYENFAQENAQKIPEKSQKSVKKMHKKT